MAAYTINNNDAGRSIRFLEDVSIVNQTAASTAVTKAVRVPLWARSMSLYLYVNSTGGTTPSLAFTMGIPKFSTEALFAAPTDDNVSLLGVGAGWDGITTITGAGPYLVTIHISPDVATEDTGSATADSTYYVQETLPPWVIYTYTTTDAADDADYDFELVAVFKAN